MISLVSYYSLIVNVTTYLTLWLRIWLYKVKFIAGSRSHKWIHIHHLFQFLPLVLRTSYHVIRQLFHLWFRGNHLIVSIKMGISINIRCVGTLYLSCVQLFKTSIYALHQVHRISFSTTLSEMSGHSLSLLHTTFHSSSCHVL